jgi:hypothetical protein
MNLVAKFKKKKNSPKTQLNLIATFDHHIEKQPQCKYKMSQNCSNTTARLKGKPNSSRTRKY